MKQPFKLGMMTVLVLSAFPAMAADETSNLKTIEVRGSRTPAKLGETTTKRKTLDENMVQDMRDLVRYDPAVSVVEGGRGSTNGFVIRGVDKDRVAVNIDGLAQAESRSSEGFQELYGAYGNYNANRNANELEHISEVSIKKGADSITSGSGALGGSVNYKTKSPTEVVNEDKPLYLGAKTGYTGRDKGKVSSIDVAGYLKGFDARFVYTHRQGHELRNNNNGATDNVKFRETVWDPTRRKGSASQFGSLGKFRSRTDPQAYVSRATLFKTGYHFNDSNYLSWMYEDYRMDRKTDELSNVWAADFTGSSPVNADMRKRNDVTYIKRTGVQYENRMENGLWDKLELSYDRQKIQMSTMTWDIPVTWKEGVNSDIYYGFRRIDQRTSQGQIRANKDMQFGNVTWSTSYGTGFSKATNQNDNYAHTVRAFKPTVYTSGNMDNEVFMEAESKKRHVYWNNNFHFGKALRIGLGVRRDWVTNRTLPSEKVLDSMRQAGLENAQAKFNATSYAVSADWQFVPGWTLLGKYGTAFRVPTTDEMWFAFPHPDFTVEANDKLRQEKARNIEIGLSNQGAWGNILLSGFQTRYSDFIDFAYIGLKSGSFFNTKTRQRESRGYSAPTWKNVNRDSAKIKGIELSGLWKLDSVGLPKGMFMSWTASYLKGHATQEDGSETPINALNPFGAVVGLGYVHPENRWSIKTNISYTARKKAEDTVHSYEDGANPWPYAKYSRDYVVVDLSGHYTFGKYLTLRAGVFNLFDKHYYTWDSLRSIREFGTINRIDNATGAGLQRFSAPGRNFAVSLEAKF
ncbi:TonB-dependent hemoglobin/transferrin/lactoferrin family receptor [Kingella kingae]|uniref:TonB-dependent hemoglobin/transferrin/lactoferrin family receptor n=1 Tax=Kingella kingae TaxID=504 RepID=UPI000418CF0D|nr:TonB-dependent hemoglobin/transferrin/lactoferrin family receptor [Kingella kingae]MDK4575252.1 TonB-dependent hemoglobin/transferrin/lactoferrin family receptor [Kingella kingae]MDK4607368.1 TonB-dependent hemoglobin/transferrin/lactoferrin family receptor [Kingella kingae]